MTSIPEMLAVIKDAGDEIERLRAEREDLLVMLRAAKAAINPVDRSGLSMREWNTALVAVTEAITAVVARAEASELIVGTARKQGEGQ